MITTIVITNAVIHRLPNGWRIQMPALQIGNPSDQACLVGTAVTADMTTYVICQVMGYFTAEPGESYV